MDELLQQFLVESRELMAEATRALRALEADPADQTAIDAAFRAVHTLKGSVALFDMAPAGRVLHAAEDALHRARSTSSELTDAARKALVRSLDKVDGWIDAVEISGVLPAEASEEAGRLESIFSGEDLSPGSGPDAADKPSWLTDFLLRHEATITAASGRIVAFRYAPDPECFFRGDDPLALIGGLADIGALDIQDARTSPDLDSLDPFRCHLVFEGFSTADLQTVSSHFRIVGGQVECHAIQPPKAGTTAAVEPGDSILRVDVERIDALADDIGELLVAGQSLEPLVAAVARLDPTLGTELRTVNAGIERSLASLQRRVSAIRLVPIAPAIRRLPRLVRDLSDDLGKDVEFLIEGELLEVDKAVADTLFEPLLHLVRNAVDHGIEPSGTRPASGKPAKASICLSFRRQGEMLEVRLSDDGRGIDPVRIRQVAADRGLLTQDQAALLDDDTAIDLIFMPGLSSADAVTGVSGRGVGMDAVRAALGRVGARIGVQSVVGSGTTMIMHFPLNAMTTRMLIVRTGADRYAVPFDRVAETTVVTSERIMPLGDGEALVLRDRTVPLVHLAEALGDKRPTASELRLLVAQIGSDRVAFSVDGFGQRIESNVRPATGILAAIPGVIGTTLLGNGDVLLVIDPARLIA